MVTIMGLVVGGAVFGLLCGAFISPRKIGCTALLMVPVAMVGYVALWQSIHPENLRSTSALDYMFGPLWPSLGALVGFALGSALRRIIKHDKR